MQRKTKANNRTIKIMLGLFVVFSLFMSVCIVNMPSAEARVRIKKIILNVSKKEMKVGDTFKLKVKKVKPLMASKKVKWKSSDKSVVSVSKKGLLKAKKVGNVKITATSKIAKKVKAICKVSVIGKDNNTVIVPTAVPNNKGTPEENPTEEPVNVVPTITPIISSTEEPGLVEPMTTEHPTEEPTAEPAASPSDNPTETPKPTSTPMVGPTNPPTTSPTATPEPDKYYEVKFVDYDGTVLNTESIKEGESAYEPDVPQRIGYIFDGWDSAFNNVMGNMTITAQYRKDTSKAIIVSDVKAVSGQRNVQVAVYIINNPGVLGMTISVLYDESVMSLKNAVNGEAFNGVLEFTKANILKNGCNFMWDGQELSAEDIKDGEILVLTFDISEEAQHGEYAINFYYVNGDIVDKDLIPLNYEVRSGSIKI